MHFSDDALLLEVNSRGMSDDVRFQLPRVRGEDGTWGGERTCATKLLKCREHVMTGTRQRVC